MNNFIDKIKRYSNDLHNDSEQSFYSGMYDLYDHLLDGNLDFLLSSADEYLNDNGDVLDIGDRLAGDYGYDDFTVKVIYRFIKEFQSTFPNIISSRELLERIKANLKHSIYVEDLSSEMDVRTGNVLSGYYNPKTKKIFIDKDLTSEDMDSILFHELIHCITIRNENKSKKIVDDLDSIFVTETITSIMQEKFQHSRYRNYDKRANNYITNYSKQLAIIVGDELFDQYINNYRDISSVFEDFNPRAKVSNYEKLNQFKRMFNLVNVNVKNGNKEYTVDYVNTIFELNMVIFLSDYLRAHPELDDHDKLSKIDRLLNIQKNPNFDLYRVLLNTYINNKSEIYRYPSLNFVMYPARINCEKNYLLKDKYIRFLASKRAVDLRILDGEGKSIFYTYGNDYIEYLRKQNYYNAVSRLYYDCDINVYNSDIEEVYGEHANLSHDLVEELRSGVDVSNNRLLKFKNDNMNEHNFLFKASKGEHSIYVENLAVPNIYTKRNIDELVGNNASKVSFAVNKKISELREEGIDEVYIARRGRHLITEKNGKVTVHKFNPVRLRYESREFNTKPIYLSELGRNYESRTR